MRQLTENGPFCIRERKTPRSTRWELWNGRRPRGKPAKYLGRYRSLEDASRAADFIAQGKAKFIPRTQRKGVA